MDLMPRTADSTALSRLSKNVSRLLDEQEMSGRQLALKSGVSTGVIGHLLRAEREPSVSTLEKLCDVLGVTMNDLLRETPPRKAKATA
jgi:transcriptional regulator with XRE-family HTH domain